MKRLLILAILAAACGRSPTDPGSAPAPIVPVDVRVRVLAQPGPWMIWFDSLQDPSRHLYGFGPSFDTVRLALPDSAAHVLYGLRLSQSAGFICSTSAPAHRGAIVRLDC